MADRRGNGSERDELFAADTKLVSDFNFGVQTASVFDDMLSRSVPFYAEIQRMMAEIVNEFAVDGSNVYDLGCSTCATFRALAELERDVTFVGLDNSAAMLERGRKELEEAGLSQRVALREHELDRGAPVENASVVIMCLTLQFVRPLDRERVIRDIYAGLNPNGCLILIEKVLANESLLNRLFIKYYYDFKRRNGYSSLEISQKREALENVLIPYRFDENVALLQSAGFRCVEPFFKWYNFCGFLALK
ncbi:MAG: carboxy-S-adenosyl-L-methionine synthase CmoA [Myxococcales bacterium]|nr:carboxy-S-adenosyl-L-methionine synthase CmoA [Myxococcales bacterium]MDH5306500.1 carboxy-S-adenosyl-L-methionine synthase CmoA [Myxococcales bacterium]MDH5565503.1 carboxy-S-adenosyl-L-methionine synthase CmoA [Myxococcales bacterium]